MHTCPQCKGKTTVSVTAHKFVAGKGFISEPPVDLTCPTCNGKGEIDDRKMEAYEFEQNMWCKCGNPSGNSKRWDDGEGIIHKHHYTCLDCGKITQVG